MQRLHSIAACMFNLHSILHYFIYTANFTLLHLLYILCILSFYSVLYNFYITHQYMHYTVSSSVYVSFAQPFSLYFIYLYFFTLYYITNFYGLHMYKLHSIAACIFRLHNHLYFIFLQIFTLYYITNFIGLHMYTGSYKKRFHFYNPVTFLIFMVGK